MNPSWQWRWSVSRPGHCVIILISVVASPALCDEGCSTTSHECSPNEAPSMDFVRVPSLIQKPGPQIHSHDEAKISESEQALAEAAPVMQNDTLADPSALVEALPVMTNDTLVDPSVAPQVNATVMVDEANVSRKFDQVANRSVAKQGQAANDSANHPGTTLGLSLLKVMNQVPMMLERTKISAVPAVLLVVGFVVLIATFIAIVGTELNWNSVNNRPDQEQSRILPREALLEQTNPRMQVHANVSSDNSRHSSGGSFHIRDMKEGSVETLPAKAYNSEDRAERVYSRQTVNRTSVSGAEVKQQDHAQRVNSRQTVHRPLAEKQSQVNVERASPHLLVPRLALSGAEVKQQEIEANASPRAQVRALCPELVVPPARECTVVLPRVFSSNSDMRLSGTSGLLHPNRDDKSRGDRFATIDDLKGKAMFHANFGDAGADPATAPWLTLSPTSGSKTMLSIVHETPEVAESLTVYDGSRRPYGRLDVSDVWHNGSTYTLTPVKGSRIHFQTGGTTAELNATDDEGHLLAMVEPVGMNTQVRTPGPSDRRQAVIGPEVDVCLIISCLMGIDWLQASLDVDRPRTVTGI
eukprot:TRINITY_DN1688_c0_g1_i4.p1 TRINITY_DN1688_c0_g1~~TRINITY_DN1688_c0_g1_i4.p1  ORF type:complete len:583 (-),score=86.13 TRINITY_DN1688_c0_g1_i4:40-1788(-)